MTEINNQNDIGAMVNIAIAKYLWPDWLEIWQYLSVYPY